MWCMGTNWAGWRIKENSPTQFDFWSDCSCTVYTDNNYVSGVRLIMSAPRK